MANQVHGHRMLVCKIGHLPFRFEFLHFGRISGGMGSGRVRRGGVAIIASPEFKPESIADGRSGMHDAVVADGPWCNNNHESEYGDNAAEQPSTAHSLNFQKRRQKEKGKNRENGWI